MSAIIVKTLWMYGLAAVVSMLMAGVIRVIVVILGRLDRAAAPAPKAVAAPAAPMVDLAADHIAAISAAVYAMIGAHRIVHIEDYGRGAGWVAEGRLAHHASHTVPTHPAKH